ncbi:MAG: hypothetical protein GYB21_00995 [Oceanospirillales bacterium]|nr:hypothetical protein [Oceanospirillales bacterium]
MYFLACDQAPTASGAVPECASGWLVVPESVVVQTESTRLTTEDYQQLYGWVLLLMVTAIGIKYVVQVINQKGGRDA